MYPDLLISTSLGNHDTLGYSCDFLAESNISRMNSIVNRALTLPLIYGVHMRESDPTEQYFLTCLLEHSHATFLLGEFPPSPTPLTNTRLRSVGRGLYEFPSFGLEALLQFRTRRSGRGWADRGWADRGWADGGLICYLAVMSLGALSSPNVFIS